MSCCVSQVHRCCTSELCKGCAFLSRLLASSGTRPSPQHNALYSSVGNLTRNTLVSLDLSAHKAWDADQEDDVYTRHYPQDGIAVTCFGATALADALSQNSSLTRLALHGHKIDAAGARALASSIAHHRHILKSQSTDFW